MLILRLQIRSYRVESGSFKPAGATSNESEYTFYYDDSFNFLGGVDKFDFGSTVNVYDSSWNVTTSVDTSAILNKLSDNLTAVTVDGDGNAEGPGVVKIPKGFLDAALGGADVADLQIAREDNQFGDGYELTYVIVDDKGTAARLTIQARL